MKRLFLDIETTGIDIYNCEILTAFFICGDDSFSFKSQVNKWSDEAAAVHGIGKEEMHTYPTKKVAFDGLVNWLSALPLFESVVYANPNTQYGYYHFDVGMIQFELMNHLHVDRLELQPFKPQKITSVYTMAKQAAKDGLFTPIKGDSGRVSFSQENVYAAMFGEIYNAHDAKSDVMAMKRIYDYIESGVVNRDQGVLI